MITSYIIVTTDQHNRDAFLITFYNDNAIDAFDQTIISLETSIKPTTQSIGIEDIKQMHKKIFLKPIKSPQKAIIVYDAEALTTEAQNALLKVLEEPPEKTIILLCTSTQESLLPTILSRCKIVELKTEKKKLTDKKREEFDTFIESLTNAGVGEKLKQAEHLAKDKDKALEWLANLIVILREKMLAADNPRSYAAYIKAFQSLHTLLKTTNVNPRLAIENTFLQLTH